MEEILHKLIRFDKCFFPFVDRILTIQGNAGFLWISSIYSIKDPVVINDLPFFRYEILRCHQQYMHVFH